MHRIKAVFAAAALAALAVFAAQAPAGASVTSLRLVPAATQASFHFTPAHPHFSKTDSNGTFSAQVSYKSKGLPVAWSFRLAKALQVIATSRMDCNAGLAGTKRYHDHHNIPVNSLWHSSIPNNKFNTKYVLKGTCKFDVNIDGLSGTATVTFFFHFEIGK